MCRCVQRMALTLEGEYLSPAAEALISYGCVYTPQALTVWRRRYNSQQSSPQTHSRCTHTHLCTHSSLLLRAGNRSSAPFWHDFVIFGKSPAPGVNMSTGNEERDVYGGNRRSVMWRLRYPKTPEEKPSMFPDGDQ